MYPARDEEFDEGQNKCGNFIEIFLVDVQARIHVRDNHNRDGGGGGGGGGGECS